MCYFSSNQNSLQGESNDPLDDIKLPGSSSLFQQVNNLLLCFPSQASLQDSIYLLKFLALKGHKVSKGKLQFVQTQIS